MTELELLRMDHDICVRELERAEQHVRELEAMQRQLEYDIAEAERELERDYA